MHQPAALITSVCDVHAVKFNVVSDAVSLGTSQPGEMARLPELKKMCEKEVRFRNELRKTS